MSVRDTVSTDQLRGGKRRGSLIEGNNVKRPLLLRYAPIALVCLVGIAGSAIGYLVLRSAEHERARAETEKRALTYSTAVQRGIDRSIEVVDSVGGFFEGSQEVTRTEFAAFTRTALARHDDIQALEWTPRVGDAQRAAYEDAARLDGFPEFRLTERSSGSLREAGQRPEYYPGYFVEPWKGNEPALGYDLASNPTRREALETARDTGSVTATARIRLVQERGNQSGLLVFRPIYGKGAPVDSVEQRRENLLGFALGVFRVGDLVEASLRGLPTNEFDLYVEDAEAPDGRQSLYVRRGDPESATTLSPNDGSRDKLPLTVKAPVTVADRQWLLRLVPTAHLVQATSSSRPRDGFLFGLGLTLAATGYMYTRLRRSLKVEMLALELSEANAALQSDIAERQKAEKQARDMQERLQLQVRRMPIGLITWDTHFVVQSWNPAAEKIFGFSAQEALGKHAYELIVPPQAQDQVTAIWNRLLDGDTTAHGTNENVGKDGRTIVCEWSNTPLRKGDGTVWGVLSMVQDVTEQVQARKAIERHIEFERTVSRISSRFVGSTDTDVAINQALADIGMLSRADRAYLFLFREGGSIMDNTHEWCAAGVSPQADNLKDLPSDMFPWWMSRLRKGEIIHITDVSQLPPEASAEKEILQSQDIKSLLVLPMTVNGQLAGFLGFDNVRQTGTWKEDDLAILRTSSEIIGNAVERFRAQQDIEARRKRLEAVYQVSQAVAGSLDARVVAREALESALSALGLDAGIIRYVDQTSKDLVLLADQGYPEEAAREVRARPRLMMGEGLVSLVAQVGEPLEIEDAAVDSRAIFKAPWSSGFHGYLGVPLKVQQEVVGVLNGLSRERRRFTAEDVQLATSIGNVVGMAIANARLFDQVNASARQWEHTFNAMGDGVAIADTNFRIRRANAALARMVGSTPEALVGQRCYHVMHGLSGPLLECPTPRCLAEKRSCNLLRQEPKVGYRWLDFVSDPLVGVHGEMLGVVHVIRDVTEETEQRDSLERLHRLSQALSASLDLDMVLNRALDEITTTTTTTTTGILLFDELRQSGVVKAARGPRAQAVLGTSIPLSIMQTERIRSLVEKAEPLEVKEISTVWEVVRDIPLFKESRSFVALPLGQPGKVLGALFFADAEGQLPQEWQMVLLGTYANEISLAVQNTQLFARTDAALRRQVAEMEALLTMLDSAGRSLDPGAIVRGVLDKAAEGLGVDRAGIMLLDETKTKVTLQASYQADNQSLVAGGLDLDLRDLPALAKVLREATPLAIDDVGTLPEGEERALAEAWGARSALVVPMVLSGNTIGTLNFTTVHGPKAYTQHETILGQAMAVHLASIVQNARHHELIQTERNALSSIMASMSDGLVVVDKRGTLAYCNPSAERVLDIVASDLVGKPVAVFERAWQGRVIDHDRLVRAWNDAVLRAPERPTVEFDLLSGGQRLTVRAVLFRVNALGTGVVLRDITREREVDRMKTEFISIVSHELRTPMTVVYGFAELLLMSQGLTGQQREWAGRIHSEGQRLTNIVEDLLNVSRIETGRLSLRLAPVSLRPLVARVGDALSPRYPTHVFQIDIPEDAPVVLGDEEKLIQVLHNLMDNAAKYSPQGGPVTVSAHANTEGREVVISVTDHGLGIPQAEMPRLFTRFHRVQRPEAEGIRGTGLGLYIVKSLVELMGGRVRVESIVNEGSTFYVVLPLAEIGPGVG